ncbi:testis-expressed protein 11 isoform X1 [Corythoichthys intestinalis]|uniref:testis-expressed protein 11 isoform X1 n=1 Tax=Corythoichthys intestinalis TaxID=161448 RepID=UPI0025A5CAFD|nr:testis-expressed protein 11 isoform X1 [Corythoichthys intestinalis]
MEQIISSVARLTADLVQNQQPNTSELIDTIFSEVSVLKDDEKVANPQLEECAIQLWNWAVVQNIGESFSQSQKAKVCNAAYSLLYRSEPVHPTEGTIRNKITMTSITGKSWLDCNNYQMADHFLGLAVKGLETLFDMLASRGQSTADVESAKTEVEMETLRILTFQAESAILQGSHQEAVVHVQRGTDMLQRLPTQTTFLSLKCYNFGIGTYNEKEFEKSVFWLRQSYNIGKIHVKYTPDAKIQARTLRCLATVYFDWDAQKFYSEALAAVEMANQECVTAFGLFLKIKILLGGRVSDESIRASLDEMLRCSEVYLKDCLWTVKLLETENRGVPALELLKRAIQQYESSPELGTALVLHVRLLLHLGKESLARQKIEDVITVHYSGRQLAPQDLQSLHAILWDKASKHFEAANYSEALQWYNYSLRFFLTGEMDSNMAKLQRNRASCFMHLKQLENAKAAIKDAELCEPGSMDTQFSMYCVALQENNMEQAAEVANKMALQCKDLQASTSEKGTSNLLCLAAQMALENKQQDIATKLLESLCDTCKDEALVLNALRCLIRLVLTSRENSIDEERDESLDVLMPYLKIALQKLSPRPSLTAEQCAEEADWFRKIAWNSALQCESNPEKMRDFFVLSYRLSQICRPDRAVLSAQKTCLLMAVAAALQFCRDSTHADRKQDLSQALEHIALCAELWKTLRGTGSSFNDTTDKMLLLYEFEARVKLNDPSVESLLDSVLERDDLEVKLLETIAALSTEPPAYFPLLSKKALRVALSLHKKQPQTETAQFRCLHQLINLTLPSGASNMDTHLLLEAQDYYEEARALIAATPNGLPEMQILWLLTCAWNTGVELFCLKRYQEAEKWCGLAMSFLRYLGPLKDGYKTQMSGLYGEILNRLEKEKNATSFNVA